MLAHAVVAAGYLTVIFSRWLNAADDVVPFVVALVLAATSSAFVAHHSRRAEPSTAMTTAPVAFAIVGQVVAQAVPIEHVWIVAPVAWSAVAGVLVPGSWWGRALAVPLAAGIGTAVCLPLPSGVDFYVGLWLAPVTAVVLVDAVRARYLRRRRR